MIGLRSTARGLWVHGTVLPWNRIPEMRNSCAVNGGTLAFGPIGSGPMWGFWCCGKWGCTEAWRPDTGRGALTGVPPAAMALGQSRQEADIAQLARALNEPFCIPASGWLKIVDKAIAFASENTPYALSFYRLAPGNAIAIGRSDMARAKAPLEWWRNRLAAEGNVVYCKGTNIMPDGRKVPTRDRELLQQVVMQPYIAANGIAGAKDTIRAATGDLVVDIVTAAPLWRKDYAQDRKDLLPWWLNTDYLVPIGIAAVAAGIFFRVKGSAPIIRPAAPPAEQPLGALPPEALPPAPPVAPRAPASPRTSPARVSPARTSPARTSGAPMSSKPRVSKKLSGPTSLTRSAPPPVARDWAEYKRRLQTGEPRDGRRAERRRNREVA